MPEVISKLIHLLQRHHAANPAVRSEYNNSAPCDFDAVHGMCATLRIEIQAPVTKGWNAQDVRHTIAGGGSYCREAKDAFGGKRACE